MKVSVLIFCVFIIKTNASSFGSSEETSSEINEGQRILPPELHVNIKSTIRQGAYCNSCFLLLKNEQLLLRELIPMVYEKNLTYAEKLIEFFQFFPNIDDRIYGLRLLFDEMKLNGHLYSTVTTTIAYQVFNIFHLQRINNEHFIYLRDNLPTTFKTFPWNDSITITNLIAQQPLLGSSNRERRNNMHFALTFNSCSYNNRCQWNLEWKTNGTYFNIKNKKIRKYLYSNKETYAEENHRRNVYFWKGFRHEATEATGRWQFQGIEGTDYFKIKNLYFNEYMYVDEMAFANDSNIRIVYTWGECEESGCKWKIARV